MDRTNAGSLFQGFARSLGSATGVPVDREVRGDVTLPSRVGTDAYHQLFVVISIEVRSQSTLFGTYHCEIHGSYLQQPHQHHVSRAHSEAEPHSQTEANT